MLEHIQADVWVRYQRMRGNEVHFICADDAHGTPIMLKAQQLGIRPEEMIAEMSQEHQKDFAGFGISYDNYHSTHSDENRVLSELIYGRLKENGFIKNRTISQLYDPEKGMFLPDRFVKGTCPKCKSPDQYGDNCEVCGATYSPTELIEPKSVVSGATPVLRDSEHYFFDLPEFSAMLQAWTRSGALQEQVANKMQEWFEHGLQQWDISRDAPYFGFEIPDAPGKYFYVWLDAPIGYMGSFKNLCDRRSDLNFDEFWKKTPRPNCTISSVKTSFTSTACSGRQCWKAAVSASRLICSCTAMSPSTVRKCPSPVARSSKPARILTIWMQTACVTTTRQNCLHASTILT